MKTKFLKIQACALFLCLTFLPQIHAAGSSIALTVTVDTVPPLVTIANPLAASEVSKGGFAFSGQATDSTGVKEVRVFVRDFHKNQFTVVNPLADYDRASGFWSFQVLPAHFTPGSNVELWVIGRDRFDNWSGWQTRTVAVQADPNLDLTPPTVSLTVPAEGATVSKDGFIFRGQATDPSGVTDVRVYVVDFRRRGGFTIYKLADYDTSSGTWTFQVLPAYVTPGFDARLWVRAKDKADNWSAWQSRIVTVRAE